MRFRYVFAPLVFALTLPTAAVAQKTSDPDERRHWAEVLHKLEADP